jgi:hypothetical protein
MVLETFIAATMAAALALAGNYLLLRFQTKKKVQEERREFVRRLHAETVDMVVDLDLFVRSIRAAAVAGPDDQKELAEVEANIESRWERDLLRRVRRARFGHPDPDVREAAEAIDDEMWPYLVMARSRHQELHTVPRPKTSEQRSDAVKAVERSMVKLRRAVYSAPHRDVPNIRYSGDDIPSRLSRSIAQEDSGATDGLP